MAQPDNHAATRTSSRKTTRPRGARATAEAVRITSPQRVVFADAGIDKGRVAEYYRAVAALILPELADRPLSLVRCPDGAAGACFFQKHHSASLGAHVHAIALAQKSGVEDYLYIRDAAGLLELAQMNALEFHPWGARVDDPEHPDRLVFDLDPDTGIAFAQVRAAAREVRAQLGRHGLDSFVRLTGGKGLHVVAPIRPAADWETAKAFCERIADELVARRPDAYVATMSKARRTGRIFIDWLRNARGSTSVTSWSLRARPGAPVAVPLRWDELGRIQAGNQFGLVAAQARAGRLRRDPWEGIDSLRQSLPRG